MSKAEEDEQRPNSALIEKALFQLNLFFLALSFFTRIPVPEKTNFSVKLLNQANRYFSLVGIILGVILAFCFYLISSYFSITISVVLTMMISLLLTGAFHEDGLADMADGIGGSFEVGKRLVIMKDSRIGTYGAVTLFISLLLKFTLLVELAQYSVMSVIAALVLASALSRAVAASLISSMPYVSDENSSKSKPLASSQSGSELVTLLLIGIFPLFFYSIEIMVISLIVLFLFQRLFRLWLLEKISGFTGDCLGAAQQISELIIYLILVCYLSPDSITLAESAGTSL